MNMIFFTYITASFKVLLLEDQLIPPQTKKWIMGTA